MGCASKESFLGYMKYVSLGLHKALVKTGNKGGQKEVKLSFAIGLFVGNVLILT